jgi:flagellar L-ring protein precursor FlgH
MKFSVMWVVLSCGLLWAEPAKPKPTPIDEYIAGAQDAGAGAAARGSLFVEGGALSFIARDPRASAAGDLITIVVADRASAISKGAVTSSRNSEAQYGIGALAGPIPAGRALSELAKFSGEQKLDGQGETSRENTLSTTLSARVTHALPNGVLVVEGRKNVMVNSEAQLVRVRGLIRREDVGSLNTVRSDRIAELEISINGKGVVADAVKRPFILYRILLGLLPF